MFTSHVDIVSFLDSNHSRNENIFTSHVYIVSFLDSNHSNRHGMTLVLYVQPPSDK